jgi:hypothetical protein
MNNRRTYNVERITGFHPAGATSRYTLYVLRTTNETKPAVKHLTSVTGDRS